MTYDELIGTVLTTPPEDWLVEDESLFVCRKNLDIRIVHEETGERDFVEPWAQNFADKNARLTHYTLKWTSTKIKRYAFVAVDGWRATLPIPRLDTMEISREEFLIACIVNLAGDAPYKDYFARYIKRFKVVDDDNRRKKGTAA